jgi:hypothetical protein
VNLRRLRHDWPVRWAHHPLCARHANETWRLGPLHLCRGCISLASGLLGAALVVAFVGGSWCLSALAALAPPLLILSWPPRYRRLPRPLRDILRIGAGALLVLAFWTTWQFPLQAWPVLPLLFALWRVYAHRRARLQARACDGCPEFGAGGVCSGYALHAARMRAYEAEIEASLGDALAGAGSPPRSIKPRPRNYSVGWKLTTKRAPPSSSERSTASSPR